ncbi:peptide-methionine (S)-S-oxide reductase [Maricaulis sp.]|uniref:peptide-methionine (S)-S-oxide reductase n=1 Tax=Maricaulis sp. TaxID=1486257 RepID=UPI0026263E3F|nr:peptide-methionine (S)-S-oxide reductase [Maricaulis sp.]
MTLETIGFGGGCHWCTEVVFTALNGVASVEQGFIRSIPPAGSWSEAVRIGFDPCAIDLASLIEIHLRTHASTSAHSMREKYRSAIYTLDAAQAERAGVVLETLQAGFEAPIITKVLPLSDFNASPPQFQNYYASNPERPFCQRYIDPKLKLIREQFAKHAA